MDNGLQYIVQARSRILPAQNIPSMGFGSDDITVQEPNGRIVRGTMKRVFKLSCEDNVSEHEQCGGVCPLCRSELQEVIEREGLLILSEQADWICTPCSRHWYICQFPLCGIGGCVKHMAMAPDGRVYCKQHFLAITDSLHVQQMEEQHGILATKSFLFLRSLFY